jgi:hypothetical protein
MAMMWRRPGSRNKKFSGCVDHKREEEEGVKQTPYMQVLDDAHLLLT